MASPPPRFRFLKVLLPLSSPRLRNKPLTHNLCQLKSKLQQTLVPARARVQGLGTIRKAVELPPISLSDSGMLLRAPAHDSEQGFICHIRTPVPALQVLGPLAWNAQGCDPNSPSSVMRLGSAFSEAASIPLPLHTGLAGHLHPPVNG